MGRRSGRDRRTRVRRARGARRTRRPAGLQAGAARPGVAGPRRRRTTCRCRSPRCASCSGRRRSRRSRSGLSPRDGAQGCGASEADGGLPATGDSAAPIAEVAELYGRRDDIAALGRASASTALSRRRAGGDRQDPARPGRGPRDVGAFADGMWVIELAPVIDPALARRRWRGRSTYDRRRAGRRSRRRCSPPAPAAGPRQLRARARGRRRPRDALRRRAPGIQVLATSQEPLSHPDEHVYRLGPLSFRAKMSTQPASTRPQPPAPCSSSSPGRARSSTAFRSRRRTSPAWSRSAAGSTASRSRSSSAPRACRCSASTGCGSASTSAFAC